VDMVKLMDKALKYSPAAIHPLISGQIDPLLPELERVLVRDKVGYSLAELRVIKHLDVGAVARQVGYGAIYELWNPMLSKLVHSTAYNVLVAGKDVDGIGASLVERAAIELRATAAKVDRYLEINGLPRYPVAA
jgi:hypothetical protein